MSRKGRPEGEYRSAKHEGTPVRAAATPLSLSYYTVPELAPPAMVRAAADAGFDFVGVRLLDDGAGEILAALH